MDKRANLAGLMDLFELQAARFEYLQARPMESRHIATAAQLMAALAEPQGLAMDCSETVTLVCRLAGLKNPSGLAYSDGQGNSRTIWAHLPHYSDAATAKVGAIVTFGPKGADHVMMVRHPDRRDPVLFGFGGHGGPRFARLSAEIAAHRAPHTFCSILPLL